MSVIVDSKETPLPAPEVILESIRNDDNIPYPAHVLVAAIAREMTMPSADTVQIGNTVYLGHRGKGENKDKMLGRAFNIDTGKNFIENSFKYFNYLQRKGYTRYVTQYDGDVFDSAFRVFNRAIEKSDSQLAMIKRNGKTVAAMKIGKEPLRGGMI